MNIDNDTAIVYGKIKAGLRKKGTPIPENDIWIASSAVQHKLKLSTRDKHFLQITGLKTLAW
ncbi:putative nucleic acid-binding protein [Pedobacter sp. W3I1]|uniref:PIN domain-containing protein n=1 Tax=Pedobacter sp. W3I1 TaxID=3042291 RepID=UPI00277ECED1|nr:PIN domain-containing protein [Pedobacter sp. W3I1]MDQ0639497.1 putative nucleic acid-binding protein [Pedobacter sp. W3I1]